jgi:8-oxo-(d)GTP phosphatase
MLVYLVRHAHAGQRYEGHNDLYRPLSEKGEARAQALVGLFSGVPISRVLTSTATRCRQTVAPLAADRGLEVEEFEVLWEDAFATETLRFLEAQLTAEPIVACSHGNIIPEIVDLLARQDVPVVGHGCEKGSVWVLTHEDGEWTEARRIKKRTERLRPPS